MHPLNQLVYTDRVAKRAQYEAYEFELVSEGVRVRNCSHADPAAHEYVVTVENGVPTSCDCPADEHYEGACKHRVAVAIRRPIVDAAAERQVRADGGEVSLESETEESQVDLISVSVRMILIGFHLDSARESRRLRRA